MCTAFGAFGIFSFRELSGGGKTHRISAIMASRQRGGADRRRRSRVRRILLRGCQVFALFPAASFLAVFALRWIPPFTTAVMLERRMDAWRNGRAYKLDYRWVRMKRISPEAGLAVIASEDQNFATHHGFDFDSIQNALEAHEHGRRLRGASTISQQVAKNIFLWSGRSYVRKALEAYFTVLIESTWPKCRILEVYLNIVELGDGLFGVEAAGRRYFGKSAANLGPGESALLAAVLPNPLRLKVSHPSAYVEERCAWILQQMSQLGGTSFIRRLCDQ